MRILPTENRILTVQIKGRLLLSNSEKETLADITLSDETVGNILSRNTLMAN
jgi:hypothetical protein